MTPARPARNKKARPTTSREAQMAAELAKLVEDWLSRFPKVDRASRRARFIATLERGDHRRGR